MNCEIVFNKLVEAIKIYGQLVQNQETAFVIPQGIPGIKSFLVDSKIVGNKFHAVEYARRLDKEFIRYPIFWTLYYVMEEAGWPLNLLQEFHVHVYKVPFHGEDNWGTDYRSILRPGSGIPVVWVEKYISTLMTDNDVILSRNYILPPANPGQVTESVPYFVNKLLPTWERVFIPIMVTATYPRWTNIGFKESDLKENGPLHLILAVVNRINQTIILVDSNNHFMFDKKEECRIYEDILIKIQQDFIKYANTSCSYFGQKVPHLRNDLGDCAVVACWFTEIVVKGHELPSSFSKTEREKYRIKMCQVLLS